MAESHSLYAHIFAQTRQNVQLLIAQKQISESDGAEILSRLTVKDPEESSVVALAQRTEGLSMSPAPPKAEARAIWGWSSEDPNDLSFEAGDVIEVLTETNADWWTGRNRQGKQGLFPSNYVEKLPPRTLSPIYVPEPRNSLASLRTNGSVEQQRHSSPALPHPPPQALPQTHYPPPAPYYAPAGPPPGTVAYSYTPPVPAPQQQAPPQRNSRFGGFGQTMAQSAASGAGFGAGAAIGSGIINSIF